MCNDCLMRLRDNLSTEAKKVLEVLPCTKNDAMHKAGLSYALTTRAFIELEATMMVRYEEKGRSKVYTVIEHAKKTPAKEPIRWKSF